MSSFSVFMVADERDLLDILERCSGMSFVTAETTVRGVTAAVVTGTLAQWRDAVAAGSTRQRRTVCARRFQQGLQPLPRRGLGRVGATTAHARHPTTLSSWNTNHNDESLLRARQHHALLRRQPRDCCRRCRKPPVDFICTDPPYGLGFMGHEWDHGVPGVPYWASHHAGLQARGDDAGLRRHADVTTGSICAIEDAGWEVRDCLMWLYGQGFPKAPDVGMLIDKAKGAKREVVGTKLGQPGYSLADNGRTNEVYGDLHNPAAECAITAPATDLAKLWTGWANSLKPAWEPITLAMKPLDGTLAHNAETVGRGRVNINGSRIGTDSTSAPATRESRFGWRLGQRQPVARGRLGVRAVAGEPAPGRRGCGPAGRADRHAQERHDEGRAAA